MSDLSSPPALAPIQSHHRRFATARTITALILREMSTRYGRTPGGTFGLYLNRLLPSCSSALAFR